MINYIIFKLYNRTWKVETVSKKELKTSVGKNREEYKAFTHEAITIVACHMDV